MRPSAKRQPVTWRPNEKARAKPLPVLNYGNQAGGGTVHYGAVSWRFHEDDFRARSQTIERYGVSAIPADSSHAMGASKVWRGNLGPGMPGAHHEGGTRMGDDPKIPNLFIVGSSTFPTMSAFNPALTIQALAYMSADAIVNRYKNRPGPLA